MNINDIYKAVKKQRARRFSKSNQLSLGEIISKVEDLLKLKDEKINVVYDFGYLAPKEIDSWRGSYDELALDYSNHGGLTLKDFHELLLKAVDNTFEGYKGGEYTMSKDTPVWVANYGDSGHTAVLGVIDGGWQVVIITGYMEY